MSSGINYEMMIFLWTNFNFDGDLPIIGLHFYWMYFLMTRCHNNHASKRYISQSSCPLTNYVFACVFYALVKIAYGYKIMHAIR
jgi:hypothetical protein